MYRCQVYRCGLGCSYDQRKGVVRRLETCRASNGLVCGRRFVACRTDASLIVIVESRIT